MKKTLIVLGIAILVILSIIIFWPKENTVTPLPDQTQTQIPETPNKTPNAVSIYDDPDFPPGSYEAYIRDLTSGDNYSGEELDSGNITDIVEPAI